MSVSTAPYRCGVTTRLLVLVLALLLLNPACRTDRRPRPDTIVVTPPPPVPPPAQDASVDVQPDRAVVYEWGTFQLRAIVTGGARPSWSSADSSIATVDSTGLVRGVRAGETRITASVP